MSDFVKRVVYDFINELRLEGVIPEDTARILGSSTTTKNTFETVLDRYGLELVERPKPQHDDSQAVQAVPGRGE